MGKANGERVKISAEAALIAACLYYIGDFAEIMAVVLPVLVHELGHLGALKALGLRATGLRVELRGFCIEYEGEAGGLGHALAAFAGPLAGGIYALAAATAGRLSGYEWLSLTAGVSVILSVFNLLPAMPLDGGRIAQSILYAALGERSGERATRILSTAVGAALLAAGTLLTAAGGGIALLLAAIWLLLYQNEGEGIEKSTEIL